MHHAYTLQDNLFNNTAAKGHICVTAMIYHKYNNVILLSIENLCKVPTSQKQKGELMNNGSIYKPEHIRETLRYFSPGITEHNHLCLECGYCDCGLMGFTITNLRGFKTYCNTIFWGGIALFAFIVAISSGDIISSFIFMFAIYMLNGVTKGIITKTYHCPNCGVTQEVKYKVKENYK